MARGKRRKIVQKTRAAQKNGRYFNSNKAASCDGKVRYDRDRAYTLAWEVLVNANAYRCQYCGYYHVGRKPWKHNK